MTDFMIPPPPESWWERWRRKMQLHPSVQAALVGAIAVITTALLQHIWFAKENGDLKSQITTKNSRIQELEIELLPFRTLAIQKFDKADADTMKSLADTMATLQSEYSKAVLKIADQQNQIEALRMKTSPRAITPEQKISLLQLFQDAPKGEVSVTADLADTEARMYARQIEDLLKEAKYDVPGFTQSGRITLSFGAPGSFLILNNSTNQPAHAAPLQHAFKAIGIDLQGTFDSNIASTTSRVIIWIGQKP